MGNKFIEGLSALTRRVILIQHGLFMLDFRIVNAFMVSGERQWVLIDTGLKNSADFIVKSAEDRLGPGARPAAILLTHGHFDHTGSLKLLTKYWEVPAYIHPFELPYITGAKSYPLPDKNAGGGFVTKISASFPHTAIDIGHYALSLPGDHTVPGLPGWKWIFTPGHTAGHVSFFRERDRLLISGDALITVDQESFWSVLTQKETLTGPPAYLTEDYRTADATIERLVAMRPAVILPSHGRPMAAGDYRKYLHIVMDKQDVLGRPPGLH